MSALTRFDLSGRRALVTGAARGIGRAIALALAEHGADVLLVDRVAVDEMHATASAIDALGRRAWCVSADLAKTDELAALADCAWELAGSIDIVVNNAGIAYFERFNEVTLEHWRQVMAVNLDAVYFLTQRLAERMIAQGIHGRIINVSSKNALVAEAGLAPYNASKAALEAITKSLAIELGAHGITVNTIAPGIIETDIGEEFQIDPKFFDYYREHIPLQGRFGDVDDCAGAAVFLASAAGAYVTGQCLLIDGGVLCEQVPRMQFMEPYRNSLTDPPA